MSRDPDQSGSKSARTCRPGTRGASYVTKVAGCLALIGFVGWLILQHRVVFPAHDDWGYAVLDYAVHHPEGQGRAYGISALTAFVWDLYMGWSGRIAAAFAISGTFRLGVDVVRLVQCSVLFGIVLLAARICTREHGGRSTRFPLLAIVAPVAVMLCMPQRVAVGGLYWFTAAAVYAWGLPLFLAAAVVAQRRGTLSMSESALLGLAAMFSEPIGAASVAFAVFRLICLIRSPDDRSRWPFKSAYAAVPVFTFLVCTLAPGNFARHATTEFPRTGMFDQFTHNFHAAGEHLRAHDSSFFIVWTAGLMCQTLAVPRIRDTRIQIVLWLGAALFLGALQTSTVEPWVVLGLLLSAHAVVLLLHQLADRAVVISTGVYLGALASLFLVLTLSSQIAGRSLLTFVLLMVTPIASGFIGAWAQAGTGRIAALLTLLCCLFAGIPNAMRIHEGYANNFLVQDANHMRLRAAAEAYSRDPGAPVIIEYNRLPSPEFAELMPYDRPLIERWIKSYYALPHSTKFVYSEADFP
jgi:hypothetical protein